MRPDGTVTSPLASAAGLQNPTLHASPWRYSSVDKGEAVRRNRRTAWFGEFVPWVKIAGARLEVRGHDPKDEGPDAGFHDPGTRTKAPAPADGSYRLATGSPASHVVALKPISTAVEILDVVQDSLSGDYDQTDFAKQAAERAIRARWEEAAIQGDAGDLPPEHGEFDGLRSLVARGHGTAHPSTGRQLSDIDRAMGEVRAHRGRVDLIVMNRAAWVKLLVLERALGYRPDTRRNAKLGHEISYYNGVPICLSDHIPVSEDTTSLFVMTLGEPDGVFVIINKDAPGIVWSATHAERAPTMIHHARLSSALVSATDDALVEVQDWSIAP